MIRGVIFDLDGVIIDSREAMTKAFIESYTRSTGKRRGVPVQEFLSHSGIPLKKVIGLMGLPPSFYAFFREQSIRSMPKIKLCPGIMEVLEYNKRNGIKNFILSGKENDRILAILKNLGADKLFDRVIGGDEYLSKPGPEGVQRILAEYSLSKEDCIFVGDSPIDAQTAKNANVKFIAALWGMFKKKDLLKHDPYLCARTPVSITGYLEYEKTQMRLRLDENF